MRGSELKRIRKELGLSIAQASRQAEVSPRTWCRWEVSERVPPGAVKLFLMINNVEVSSDVDSTSDIPGED